MDSAGPVPTSTSNATLGNSTSMHRNLLSDYTASTSWNDVMLHSEGQRKPWKKVALAVFLCVAGAAMLAAGLGVWYSQPKPNPALALIILGSICFLPGFYHVRIAYLAYKGVRGYNLNDIPDL
eukprot:jgi/Chrzof1/12440/Cz06g34220.t1